jgi:sugar lactone lactonase YvrE
MLSRYASRFVAVFLLIATTLLVGTPAQAQEATPAASPEATPAAASGVTFVASGLFNPRGFTWGPDGTLYVTQAGIGGASLLIQSDGFTVAGGPTSSVVSIIDGCATPVAQDIHSALWVEAGWIWGAMDVEVLNEQLYVLISGSGPTWGSPELVSGIYRVNADGTATLAADLGGWLADNPPIFSAPDYAGRDGSEFDMEPAGDALLVSVADGGHIIRAVPDGEISLLADLSVEHLVPTGIAVDGDGNAYVGFETTPPYPNGASKVIQITPDGTITDVWTGLTAVTDVEIGPDGVLYAAEMSIDNSETPPFLNSTSGRIVRQTGPDSLEAVVTDAPPPVGIGFGADGALYFDAPAYGPNAGAGIGFIARVDLSMGPVSLAGMSPGVTCVTS